ncbi:OsmC family protein [Micropruina sp.]|uniref:OsmC family protein n=1 Tax=Micropruina sp. TaxID=2737536 RepID=UPI0039E56167
MSDDRLYRVSTTWRGNRGSGTSGYRDYDRAVEVEVAGKPVLLGSADKPFRGDPGRWNPEDLLLAALSQCHLLSYLHACVLRGVVVTDYADQASGVMAVQGNGGRFREVVLRPWVTVAEASMVDPADGHRPTLRSLWLIAQGATCAMSHTLRNVSAPDGGPDGWGHGGGGIGSSGRPGRL